MGQTEAFWAAFCLVPSAVESIGSKTPTWSLRLATAGLLTLIHYYLLVLVVCRMKQAELLLWTRLALCDEPSSARRPGAYLSIHTHTHITYMWFRKYKKTVDISKQLSFSLLFLRLSVHAPGRQCSSRKTRSRGVRLWKCWWPVFCRISRNSAEQYTPDDMRAQPCDTLHVAATGCFWFSLSSAAWYRSAKTSVSSVRGSTGRGGHG